jgi:hypothetical protein
MVSLLGAGDKPNNHKLNKSRPQLTPGVAPCCCLLFLGLADESAKCLRGSTAATEATTEAAAARATATEQPTAA